MLRAIATSQFRKDYKRAIKRGKDIAKLDDIIRKLATGQPLDIRHRDHALVLWEIGLPFESAISNPIGY